MNILNSIYLVAQYFPPRMAKNEEVNNISTTARHFKIDCDSVYYQIRRLCP